MLQIVQKHENATEKRKSVEAVRAAFGKSLSFLNRCNRSHRLKGMNFLKKDDIISL